MQIESGASAKDCCMNIVEKMESHCHWHTLEFDRESVMKAIASMRRSVSNEINERLSAFRSCSAIIPGQNVSVSREEMSTNTTTEVITVDSVKIQGGPGRGYLLRTSASDICEYKNGSLICLTGKPGWMVLTKRLFLQNVDKEEDKEEAQSDLENDQGSRNSQSEIAIKSSKNINNSEAKESEYFSSDYDAQCGSTRQALSDSSIYTPFTMMDRNSTRTKDDDVSRELEVHSPSSEKQVNSDGSMNELSLLNNASKSGSRSEIEEKCSCRIRKGRTRDEKEKSRRKKKNETVPVLFEELHSARRFRTKKKPSDISLKCVYAEALKDKQTGSKVFWSSDWSHAKNKNKYVFGVSRIGNPDMKAENSSLDCPPQDQRWPRNLSSWSNADSAKSVSSKSDLPEQDGKHPQNCECCYCIGQRSRMCEFNERREEGGGFRRLLKDIGLADVNLNFLKRRACESPEKSRETMKSNEKKMGGDNDSRSCNREPPCRSTKEYVVQQRDRLMNKVKLSKFLPPGHRDPCKNVCSPHDRRQQVGMTASERRVNFRECERKPSSESVRRTSTDERSKKCPPKEDARRSAAADKRCPPKTCEDKRSTTGTSERRSSAGSRDRKYLTETSDRRSSSSSMDGRRPVKKSSSGSIDKKTSSAPSEKDSSSASLSKKSSTAPSEQKSVPPSKKSSTATSGKKSSTSGRKSTASSNKKPSSTATSDRKSTSSSKKPSSAPSDGKFSSTGKSSTATSGRKSSITSVDGMKSGGKSSTTSADKKGSSKKKSAPSDERKARRKGSNTPYPDKDRKTSKNRSSTSANRNADARGKPSTTGSSRNLDSRGKPSTTGSSRNLDSRGKPSTTGSSRNLDSRGRPMTASSSRNLDSRGRPMTASSSRNLDSKGRPSKAGSSRNLDSKGRPSKASSSRNLDSKGRRPSKSGSGRNPESRRASASGSKNPDSRRRSSATSPDRNPDSRSKQSSTGADRNQEMRRRSSTSIDGNPNPGRRSSTGSIDRNPDGRRRSSATSFEGNQSPSRRSPTGSIEKHPNAMRRSASVSPERQRSPGRKSSNTSLERKRSPTARSSPTSANRSNNCDKKSYDNQSSKRRGSTGNPGPSDSRKSRSQMRPCEPGNPGTSSRASMRRNSKNPGSPASSGSQGSRSCREDTCDRIRRRSNPDLNFEYCSVREYPKVKKYIKELCEEEEEKRSRTSCNEEEEYVLPSKVEIISERKVCTCKKCSNIHFIDKQYIPMSSKNGKVLLQVVNPSEGKKSRKSDRDDTGSTSRRKSQGQVECEKDGIISCECSTKCEKMNGKLCCDCDKKLRTIEDRLQALERRRRSSKCDPEICEEEIPPSPRRRSSASKTMLPKQEKPYESEKELKTMFITCRNLHFFDGGDPETRSKCGCAEDSLCPNRLIVGANEAETKPIFYMTGIEHMHPWSERQNCGKLPVKEKKTPLKAKKSRRSWRKTIGSIFRWKSRRKSRNRWKNHRSSGESSGVSNIPSCLSTGSVVDERSRNSETPRNLPMVTGPEPKKGKTKSDKEKTKKRKKLFPERHKHR